MAESFSIGEALATPVRLIRRHPLAVFVWGFVSVAFSLVGLSLMFGVIGPMDFAEVAAETEPPAELMSRFVAVQGLSMLLNVGQLALSGVVWAAIMRATLRIGREDKTFFMRLGVDELRLAVVGLALFVGAYVAIIILVLLGIAVGAVVWQISAFAAVVLGMAMTCALIIAMAMAMARLSLIAPATIILERFAFVEGWNLGRGRMWRLLGLLICTWLIYMVIYALVVAVVVVVAFTTGVFAHWQALGEAATLADVLPSPSVLAFLVFLALVPGAFAYGAVMTLLCAPFAAACRELIDGPAVGRRLAVALDS